MKNTTFILFLVASWRIQNANLIDSIIKTYKRTTLQFREDDYQKHLPIFNYYDYIIIGASPSGCVLANRLTENANTTVLLIEAGPEPTLFNDFPITHVTLFDTEYNWKFRTKYNPRVCRSMDDEICHWASGRGIGGGTTINGMIYTRGNKQDYDNWEKAGNIGWGFKDILKYFIKLENVRIPNLRDSIDRGKNGPLWVSYSPQRSNASLAFIEAGKELGYPVIDYNLPYSAGFAKIQLSIKEGYRSSASNAYLKPITKRRNLHIIQKSLVLKILIDPETKTALGVTFIKKGKKRSVKAVKEVILSAGAFGSPKLLMLSGIGPKEHLESFNIEVLKDLPVGNNLQEHLGVHSLNFLVDSPEMFVPDPIKAALSIPVSVLLYDKTRNGPPSSPGIESIAYVSSRYSTNENPDIELIFSTGTFATDYGIYFRRTIGLRDDVYNSYFKSLENKRCINIFIMGCYPKSKGNVRLQSENPFDNPIIDSNFANETEDINVIIDGIKKAIEILDTDIMKSHGVHIFKRNQPGCENIPFGTDEYWDCAIRQITGQYHHQCGTCKMGSDEDPTAVVDPRLRVRGIKRLRVVDASIMPTIPGGHTQAPSYMIGEKAADMIKQDNEY